MKTGKMIWPNIETINDVVIAIEKAEGEFYTILVCLTLLRRMFTVTNREEYSIADLLKNTKLDEALNAVLELEAKDRDSIRKETLWVLLNMTYCCATNKDIEDLMRKIFKVD